MQIDLILKNELKDTVGSNKLTLAQKISKVAISATFSYFIVMSVIVLLRG